MKEAFWGVLIVMLGLVGIVIINIFQNVTIGNDRTYYLLKETAEAAAYDSIDLTYYRLNGDLRMVEDKYVENFTRRFAQSLGNNGNYYISVQEITGKPPRVSIKVSTGITSLQGDDFGITNRIDGILETEYKIGEVINFLGITEEEWLARTNVNTETDNACSVTTGTGDLECIPGDLEFTDWGAESIPDTVCNVGSYKEESRLANYKTCECGKWKEESETVKTPPTTSGTEYVYNWYFHKDGEIRDIDERTTTRAYVEKCTTAIEIYVPKDLRKSDINLAASEYELCPSGGTTVNQGQTIYWRAEYTPSDSSNRSVIWTKPTTDKTITLQYSNPKTDTGYSRASITGKELGTTIVTATTTNGKVATCKVTVLDGYADSVSCDNNSVTTGGSTTMVGHYLPYTATKTVLEWSSADSSIATINSSSGVATGNKAGSVEITVKTKNLSDNTEVSNKCTLTVSNPPQQSCRPKSEVGIYYEYDEMYCDGKYCQTGCRNWETVCDTDYVYVEKCSIGGGYNKLCQGSYCKHWNKHYWGKTLIYQVCDDYGSYWYSCYVEPYKYCYEEKVEVEDCVKKCKYGSDGYWNSCGEGTTSSGDNCKTVTRKGYVCRDGWTASGSNCCR